MMGRVVPYSKRVLPLFGYTFIIEVVCFLFWNSEWSSWFFIASENVRNSYSVNFPNGGGKEAQYLASVQRSTTTYSGSIFALDGGLQKLVLSNDSRRVTTDMLFLPLGVLWCPNAKVGTTYVYKSLQEIFSKETFPDKNIQRKYRAPNLKRVMRCRSMSKLKCPTRVENISSSEMFNCGHHNNSCVVEEDNSIWRTSKLEDVYENAKQRKSFTIVRNPWDRVWSSYKSKILTKKIRTFYLGGEKLILPPEKQDPALTFAEFIRIIATQKPEEMNRHWLPYQYRCNTGGKYQYNYTYILKLENGLGNQLQKIFAEFGYDNFREEPTINSVTNHSLQARIDAYTKAEGISHSMELVELIARAYAEDIDRFNYSFDKYD